MEIFKSIIRKETPTPTSPATGNVVESVSPAKDAGEIVAQVASQYTSGGNASESGEAQVKKRRPYRKRGSGNLEANAAPGQTVDGANVQSDAGYRLDRKIVEKTACTVLNTVDGFLTRKIIKVSQGLGADVEHSKEMAMSAALTVSERDLMAELTGVIFEKYNLLTGYAPELLLGIMIGEYGVRVGLVIRQLNELERAAAARKKVNLHVSSSPPVESADNREKR